MGFKLPAALAAAVILIVVLFTATPLRHPGHLDSSGPTRSAPSGWVAHSAFGIQISIPKSWATSYFPLCPYAGAGPGLFTISPPHPLVCQGDSIRRSATQVTLASSGGPVADILTPARHLTVNGIRVLSVELGGSKSITWIIPSAYATMSGTGPEALRVMHTLARASSGAVVAPGYGSGSEYLVALTQVRVSGQVAIENDKTGKTTHVQSFDGRFTFIGPPGRYTLIGSDGNASCAPVATSLGSGRFSTWPPILCQGE